MPPTFVGFRLRLRLRRDWLNQARQGLAAIFFNEERPCGRCEELTLFVVKNALRLLRRLRWGAKRRTRVARRVVYQQQSLTELFIYQLQETGSS